MGEVRVELFAQLAAAAGGAAEQTVSVDDQTDVRAVVATLADRYGEDFRRLAMTPEGEVRPTIVAFADGRPIAARDPFVPASVGQLFLMSPLGGG